MMDLHNAAYADVGGGAAANHNMIPPIPMMNPNNNNNNNNNNRGGGGSNRSAHHHHHLSLLQGGGVGPASSEPRDNTTTSSISSQSNNNNMDGEQQHEYPPPCTLQDIKLNIHHPLRMKIFWDELHFGLEIKNCIQTNPELDPISDFLCLQLASVSKDCEEAMERVEGLQSFKRLYEIRDTFQEGIKSLHRLVELFPEMFLALVLNPDKGNFSLIEDPSKLDFSKKQQQGTTTGPIDRHLHERIKRDFFVGIYYLMHATTPDFHSMFVGPMIMFECKDMGWSNRHEIKILMKLTEELFTWYPIGGSVLHYHTNAVINTMTRAAQKFLPTKYSEKFQVGLQFVGGLSNICLIPTPTSARQRMLKQMDINLRLRYQNESTFLLLKTNHLTIVPMSDNEIAVLEEARDMA